MGPTFTKGSKDETLVPSVLYVVVFSRGKQKGVYSFSLLKPLFYFLKYVFILFLSLPF